MLVVPPAAPSQKRWGVVVVAEVAVAVVIVTLGLALRPVVVGALPSDAQNAQYVTSLQRTELPLVEELQVEYFMDEHDCANITYPRGDFIEGDPEHCGGSTGHPAPFDDVVRADHAQVADSLARSGAPIERTSGTFSGGDLRYAFFSSTHGAPFTTSWELLYDPDELQPKRATDTVTYTQVPGEDGWWFACCSD